MLPDGFSDLVAIVIGNWDWDILPDNDMEVWDALLYPVFLGRTIRSAQANYVKDVLDPFLGMEVAPIVRTDVHWNDRVMKVINSELTSIKGTQGEGLKRAILNSVAHDIQDFTLIRTIDTALSFFDKFDVGVDLIREIRKDDYRTKEFVANAASEIHNVGYIKAVLWLYDCGIAYNLVPPNSHIKRFLTECGFSGFGWSRDEPEDWQIFILACSKMCDVAREVGNLLKITIMPKQAQAAVWYLQTCRGLLTPKYARQLSPRVLIDFLQSHGWSINDLANRLSDVEELEGLADELKNFL